MMTQESKKHQDEFWREAKSALCNSDKWIEAHKDLKWDKVFDLKPLPEGCVDGLAIFGRVPALPPRKP